MDEFQINYENILQINEVNNKKIKELYYIIEK